MSAAEVIPVPERERILELGARAVYAKRPFRMASSRSPWEPGTMEAQSFGFDEAPAYYQDDCREIASIVLDAVLPA